MKEVKKNIFKNYILPFLLLILSDIIFSITYYIIVFLKKVNTYELYYYFISETTGTGMDIILDGIKSCFLFFTLLLIIFYLPISYIKNKEIIIKNKKIYPTIFYKHKIAYSLIIFIISILVLGKTINFDKFYINTKETTKIYEKYYKNTNEVTLKMPENKRNLILIYLESMESSLMSKENGGTFETSRIPELENLALSNLNFSNTNKIGGGKNLDSTSWTIASVVAGTTGTPLIPSIRNRYTEVDSFMPKVKALGDILEENGYNLELVQGSNIKFSGTDKFYKEHGNYKIFDYKYAKRNNLIPKDYKVWWGYEDKKLFEFAKNEITELSKEVNPFAISIFTMDTHFKDGYLDKSCETPFDDQMSNVYSCSSKMVYEFINWIKEQEFYDNTTIVIIGDHQTMQNSYYNGFDNYQRTIYNTFINSVEDTNYNKNRQFSSFDMYPTILSSLGVEIEGDQLGFGVNLFSGKKTMIEKLGKKYFNEELLKSSDYYSEYIMNYDMLNNLNKKEITNYYK